MNFTFGIITNGNADIYIQNCIDNIRDENILNYEIIIVGKTSIKGKDILVIDFDETIKQAWITRKKNIICEKANYENVVLMHDYFTIEKGWYDGFLKYGNNFEICVNKIITREGRRYRDFTLKPMSMPVHLRNKVLLPYDYKQTNNVNDLMYISGGYFIIKKEIALKYPLNELLSWGEGEDGDLCTRLNNANILIKVNSYSTTKIQKHVIQAYWEYEVEQDVIDYLNTLG
jgi:hypothetical protein